MSVFVWTMVGLALWHFTILLPDRFAGGIIGAFVAAWLGGLASGFVLEGLTIPDHDPAGVRHILYAVPGAVLGLSICWWLGRISETEVAAPSRTRETSHAQA